MLKQDRTIIHVQVKDTDEHFYFGSAAAMFEDSRVKNLLGIAYQTFRKKRISKIVTLDANCNAPVRVVRLSRAVC